MCLLVLNAIHSIIDLSQNVDCGSQLVMFRTLFQNKLVVTLF